MSDITLRHRDILEDGAAAHLTRTTLTTHRPKVLHGQDFYELIWVQNGRARHHLPQGHDDLSEGDVLFVGPRHLHGLQGRGPDAFVVTVIFRPDVITGLAERHPQLRGHMFWSDTDAPPRYQRDMRQMADLNHAALRLERADRTLLEAEGFLIPLFTSLLDAEATVSDKAPDWLGRACAAAQDPKVFRDGAAGFVRAAGKAHAHVSRMARLHLGQSPSEYINDIRMVWAARRLAGTSDSLAEIATDCGLPNLSHFHRLFQARHRTTPHQYRKQTQRDVVQPKDYI